MTVVALAVLVGGCFGKGPLDTVGIATQREFWQSQNAKNYTYVSSHSCECTPNFAAALRATVRNNVMTALVVESSGQAVPLNYRPTIEGLFDFIDTEQRTRSSLLEVTYHPTLGYPTRIKYGTPATDGGGIITVTSLSITP
ncbi:MAG: hypothetical protein IPP90_10965 [Gemmatimonadaceae bacterium]|nr:hypothetical protein [Gemmatimonadaceae bacterium]